MHLIIIFCFNGSKWKICNFRKKKIVNLYAPYYHFLFQRNKRKKKRERERENSGGMYFTYSVQLKKGPYKIERFARRHVETKSARPAVQSWPRKAATASLAHCFFLPFHLPFSLWSWSWSFRHSPFLSDHGPSPLSESEVRDGTREPRALSLSEVKGWSTPPRLASVAPLCLLSGESLPVPVQVAPRSVQPWAPLRWPPPMSPSSEPEVSSSLNVQPYLQFFTASLIPEQLNDPISIHPVRSGWRLQSSSLYSSRRSQYPAPCARRC